jgi:hypothetical protein
MSLSMVERPPSLHSTHLRDSYPMHLSILAGRSPRFSYMMRRAHSLLIKACAGDVVHRVYARA